MKKKKKKKEKSTFLEKPNASKYTQIPFPRKIGPDVPLNHPPTNRFS